MTIVIESALKALVGPMSIVISVGPNLIGSTPSIDSTSRNSPLDMNFRRFDAEYKCPCRASNSESSTLPLFLSAEGILLAYESSSFHQLLDPRL